MRLRKIRNTHINDYLQRKGYYPKYENNEECWYESTPLLIGLLDDYYIEYVVIPNKL